MTSPPHTLYSNRDSNISPWGNMLNYPHIDSPTNIHGCPLNSWDRSTPSVHSRPARTYKHKWDDDDELHIYDWTYTPRPDFAHGDSMNMDSHRPRWPRYNRALHDSPSRRNNHRWRWGEGSWGLSHNLGRAYTLRGGFRGDNDHMSTVAYEKRFDRGHSHHKHHEDYTGLYRSPTGRIDRVDNFDRRSIGSLFIGFSGFFKE